MKKHINASRLDVDMALVSSRGCWQAGTYLRSVTNDGYWKCGPKEGVPCTEHLGS